MLKAYNNSLPQHFPTSCHEMEVQHPQLRYWSMALEHELKLLSFLKPVRSGNFSMKKNALKQLLQWLFAHYYYACWFTFHWYKMTIINKSNPSTCKAFQEGCFVIPRTSNPFSSMGIDRSHK